MRRQYHARLINEVDMSFPVIMGPDGRIMDEMHRVARALLDGIPAVRAVRLLTLPAPDYHDCRPEDLPYSTPNVAEASGPRRRGSARWGCPSAVSS